MVTYAEPPFFCNHCTAKGKDMTLCPHCSLHFCNRCYPKHHKLEQLIPRARLYPDVRPGAVPLRAVGFEPIPRLRDTEGTPTPAAANPFIYKRGTGRPDEPPEAAGAPNRPRIEVRRKD
jgi:hypothetical protein